MRLLLVNYEYPPLGGGGGIALQDVAEALASRHTVHVLTTHYRTLPRTEERNGVNITRVPVWGRTDLPTATIRSMVTFAPSAAIEGIRLLRSFRPDLINAYFAVPSGVPALVLGRLFRVPLVLTLIGADVYDPTPTAGIATHQSRVLRKVVRTVIRHADARVAISHDTRRQAIRYHQAPSDIEVIPLGLVPPAFPGKPKPRARPDLLQLVTIGRLIPRKAHADLLEAFALLGRTDLHLHFIGEGPGKASLIAKSERLGVSARVTFHGAVSDTDKWQLLHTADCFVSTSHHEGFGIVFLEAMYAGLPLVVTDQGGHTDFLTLGENALLVPPGQPQQFAAALRLLLGDPSLRQRMGEANRRKVQEFLIANTVAAYETLFERVCLRRARPHLGGTRPPVAQQSVTGGSVRRSFSEGGP